MTYLCGCGKDHGRIGPSGDLYMPPASDREVPVYYCLSNCGRMMCVASEAKFADHCCRRCAETSGAEHSPQCTANWAFMQPRITRLDVQFTAGDIPLVRMAGGG